MISTKIKILTVPGWYPGIKEPYNGDFICDQVSLLRNAGFRMDLIYADLNIAYVKNGQFSIRQVIRHDHHGNKDFLEFGPFWPKNNFFGLHRWIKTYASWIEEYCIREEKPDVIHAHTYLGAIISAAIKKKYGIPFIVTEHYTGWVDGTIRSTHEALGIRALQDADIVTVVSNVLQDHLSPKLSKAIKVLPNFINTHLFNYQETARNSIPQAICIGDLIPRKQVGHAILAIAALQKMNRQVHLTIVGSGTEEGALRHLVDRLALTDVVSFAGQLRKDEVASLLKKSDLLIHTSKLETFGLAIAEAICCGIPVISYDNQGVNMMSHLPGVHLCNQDGTDLVKNIEQVIFDHDPDREGISKAGRAYLGVNAVAPKLKKLYESLLI